VHAIEAVATSFIVSAVNVECVCVKKQVAEGWCADEVVRQCCVYHMVAMAIGEEKCGGGGIVVVVQVVMVKVVTVYWWWVVTVGDVRHVAAACRASLDMEGGGTCGGGGGGIVREIWWWWGRKRGRGYNTYRADVRYNMKMYLLADIRGAHLRAASTASFLRGSLPPVDLRAVCGGIVEGVSLLQMAAHHGWLWLPRSARAKRA
jgi:hypothetical protein